MPLQVVGIDYQALIVKCIRTIAIRSRVEYAIVPSANQFFLYYVFTGLLRLPPQLLLTFLKGYHACFAA